MTIVDRIRKLPARVAARLRKGDSGPDPFARVLLGKLLALDVEKRGLLPDIRQAEFKVFSQFGEDGIIQYLLRQVDPAITVKTFVEFGVERYEEANTRFLLMNDYWRGLIMDGNRDFIESVRANDLAWQYDLEVVLAFVSAENVNSLISAAGFSGEIGLLSIDVDGNDYWVWKAIDVVEPAIVMIEYNSVFGAERCVTIPYDPGFVRTQAHFSNLYWGCSLPALTHLGEQKGYAFVGSNSAGNNAFFVRRERLGRLKPLTAKEGYVVSGFRESRDREGRLTFVRGAARLAAIADMPLLDVTNGATIRAGDLPQA